MKTKILIIAAMSFAMVGFAQKSELKAADKALKGGDSQTAKTALESIAGSISGADEKYQAQYQFLTGKTYADLAKKGDATAFQKAVDAFKKVKEMPAGKKYVAETDQHMSAITADLVNSAVADNGNKNFKEAAEKLYLSYKLSPRDTSYLYFAAGSAVNGQEFEQALQYYNELQELGYDGGGVVYKATNVASGQVEEMDKTQRDLMVKSGTYKDPQDEKLPSKSAEIVKNTALIYTQLGQDEKAIEAYKAARANEPNDVNLILNEANLYYKLGDKDKFKELMAEAASVAPENADLQYNIGVINMEQGNIQEARVAYRKALEIKPDYTNAQLNLSTTYVNEGNGLIDEMNTLGNSKKDIARYDELKAQKDQLFGEGAKVLEDALKGNPENQGLLEQLKNIYGAMGDNENFMRIKKLLGE
ncbi:tetratricopeptide repeat protein [Aurantibacter crassamenti]|uniref:tetratricopeptide repeat protein n=1 Tax=Aurantibacter crassamenti TaxID=1837375 RepID=UPI00193AAB7C|nr:tetratricopeptide repeat protein [Aurantibacter crassamenti]MBM1107807.1 tetratricopeptide repeat protein [Aurantibacter crassamenti]